MPQKAKPLPQLVDLSVNVLHIKARQEVSHLQHIRMLEIEKHQRGKASATICRYVHKWFYAAK